MMLQSSLLRYVVLSIGRKGMIPDHTPFASYPPAVPRRHTFQSFHQYPRSHDHPSLSDYQQDQNWPNISLMEVSSREALYCHALIIKAAVLAATAVSQQNRRHRKLSSRLGKSPRFRTRRTVDEIYQCLGPIYFRRAYRMS